jgi:hypothetical protein
MVGMKPMRAFRSARELGEPPISDVTERLSALGAEDCLPNTVQDALEEGGFTVMGRIGSLGNISVDALFSAGTPTFVRCIRCSGTCHVDESGNRKNKPKAPQQTSQ